MYEWIKKNKRMLIIYSVTIGVMLYLYACESQVRSLDGSNRLINRAELQAELDAFLDKYDIRFASLDRQDKVRALVINNALMVTQGQPFNPAGIITGIAALYGITQATSKTKGVIKNARAKRTNNKSPTT